MRPDTLPPSYLKFLETLSPIDPYVLIAVRSKIFFVTTFLCKLLVDLFFSKQEINEENSNRELGRVQCICKKTESGPPSNSSEWTLH